MQTKIFIIRIHLQNTKWIWFDGCLTKFAVNILIFSLCKYKNFFRIINKSLQIFFIVFWKYNQKPFRKYSYIFIYLHYEFHVVYFDYFLLLLLFISRYGQNYFTQLCISHFTQPCVLLCCVVCIYDDVCLYVTESVCVNSKYSFWKFYFEC